MKFSKFAAVATSLVMFALPLAASASTSQTFLTVDGGTTATIAAGDSYNGVLTFNNTGNSTVQSIKVEIPGSGFPGECLDVADQNATGTHTVAFTGNTTGATEGTWSPKITVYGINSNLTGANNNCDGTIGSNSNHTFNNQLTLTSGQSTGSNANNTGGGSSSSSAGSIQSVKDQIAMLTLQIGCFISKGTWTGTTCTPAPVTPVPTTSAVCTAYAQANTGTVPNVYNDANVRLQGFLLSQGASIPALKAGASFGFYGNQTTAAVGWFNSLNHCT